MRWLPVVCLMSALAQAQQGLPNPPKGQVYCANLGHFVCRDSLGREVDLTKAFDEMGAPSQPIVGQSALPLFSEIPVVFDCDDCKSSEPVDVPAVKKIVSKPGRCWYIDSHGFVQDRRQDPSNISYCEEPTYKVSWSCDDKDRVLLPPDGRGRRWCHRLEKEGRWTRVR